MITFLSTARGLRDADTAELIRKHIKLTPRGIIETLELRWPIYRETTRRGHFGRELAPFSWEKTDMAATLRRAVERAA